MRSETGRPVPIPSRGSESPLSDSGKGSRVVPGRTVSKRPIRRLIVNADGFGFGTGRQGRSRRAHGGFIRASASTPISRGRARPGTGQRVSPSQHRRPLKPDGRQALSPCQGSPRSSTTDGCFTARSFRLCCGAGGSSGNSSKPSYGNRSAGLRNGGDRLTHLDSQGNRHSTTSAVPELARGDRPAAACATTPHSICLESQRPRWRG